MKKKNIEQLREKSQEALLKMAADLGIEIIKRKAELLTGREKNTRKVKNMRQEKAIILTIAREKKGKI